MIPWLPRDMAPGEAERLILSPEWFVETKEDGIHVIVDVDLERPGIIATTRNGNVINLHPAVEAELARYIPSGCRLDGEKMHEGLFRGFDVLTIKHVDVRSAPAKRRFEAVQDLLFSGDRISAVEAAFGADKRAFVARIRDLGGEGVVWKRVDAPYSEGRPAFGGPMLRQKFRKGAEVVLMRRKGDTKRSFEMFVFHPTEDVRPCTHSGREHHLGSVSAHNFYNKLAPGTHTVAEVSYLYAGKPPELHLVQPTVVRFRPDKGLSDCTLEQLEVGPRWRIKTA